MIYGIFGDAAPEIGNTHWDSTPRAAKRLTLSRNCSLVRRICRVLSVRWGSRPSGSRAARGFGPARPQKRSTFETQVAQFARGTPILSHWTVKTRHNGGPEAPGGRRQPTGARIARKHLRNVHLRMVLEVKVPAGGQPSRGRRPAALRPTVESAYRMQFGRPGFQNRRPFTARRPRIGIPEGIAFAMAQQRFVAQHQ